ncbi:MAG: radical SAM protein [Desulfovibrio sp.]|nr:radical SAM protein [Desulfovibrio sp.]
MKFCEKLFNEINFEPHSLSPCCNTENTRIPAFPYEGGEIDLNEYAKHIAACVEELQGETDLCKGCSHLAEIPGFPRMTGQFTDVLINMHRYFCNSKCVYCGYWQHPQKGKGYDPLPGLKSLRKQGALAKNCQIAWGGGEPSILPSFEEASKWCADNGYRQHVFTNSLKYSPAITDFISRDQGTMTVSLDCGDPETYKKIKGLDGFASAYASLKKYADAGADNMTLKYIVFEQNNNIKDVNNFIATAKRLGINKIEFSFDFRELNQNKLSDKTILAAAYLLVRAGAEKLELASFFIPPKWQFKLADCVKELMGGAEDETSGAKE